MLCIILKSLRVALTSASTLRYNIVLWLPYCPEVKIFLRDSVQLFLLHEPFSTVQRIIAVALRATVSMCFDYNLRNEEMTASRVCGISVPTGRENGPRRLYLLLDLLRSCLVAQMVRHLPAMWETWVQSLGWEDPLEKEMATSCLGNPMDGGAWQTTVHGVTKSPTYWASSLSLFHFKRTWTTFKSKHNIHDCHSCLLCMCVCAQSLNDVWIFCHPI